MDNESLETYEINDLIRHRDSCYNNVNRFIDEVTPLLDRSIGRFIRQDKISIEYMALINRYIESEDQLFNKKNSMGIKTRSRYYPLPTLKGLLDQRKLPEEYIKGQLKAKL